MFRQFSKAQFSAILATIVDFLSLIFFVEIMAFWLPVSTAMGALNGAITNFLLNRHWTFAKATESKLTSQAIKYAIVSLGSLLLNTGGVYVLSDVWGVFYVASKLVVAISVAVIFNYPLHRYFVFSEKNKTERKVYD